MNNRHKERYFSNKYCLWFVKNIDKMIRRQDFQIRPFPILSAASLLRGATLATICEIIICVAKNQV